MKSAQDFAYWCLRETTIYQSRKDLFVPPVTALDDSQSYGRIHGCLQSAGGDMPMQYVDLQGWLQQHDAYISVESAYRTRGAILLNRGTVSVSMGDGSRIVVEENYRLIQKYVNPTADPVRTFEYGAKIPKLAYL